VARTTPPSDADHGRRSAARPHRGALDEEMPEIYGELRRLAAAYLRRERPGQTLQATALVHEAFVRLANERHVSWQNRAHFCAIAATSMRQILVERARRRRAAKRGGDPQRVTLDAGLFAEMPASIDVEALDDALERFAAIDPVRARIVELRFFGGLSIEETADVLGMSPATVKRGWALARAWLRRDLHGDAASGG
jgi:RNA polymerase sigma factor (TIGR02999 family)